MPSYLSRVLGTLRTAFQLGGPSGPQLKDNVGVIEARNAGDTLFTRLRSGDPDSTSGNDVLDMNASYIIGSIAYGSGQDGVATFDGVNVFSFASLIGTTYTLTRDVFLLSATVSAGITLSSGGFHIYLSSNTGLVNNGIISCSGKDAALGVAGGSSPLGTLGIGTAGGNGGVNGVGLPGTAQIAQNTIGDVAPPTLKGGNGGAGGVNGGGLAGAYVPTTANGGLNYLTPMMTGFLFTQTTGGNFAQVAPIGGGSGGGGGGSDNGGVTGGGGGGGGGVLLLAAFRIVNNGIIRARGGNGAAASGAGGNGGGGGGGAGGIVLCTSRYYVGAAPIAPGGLGGAGLGTGAAGANGNDGHVNRFTF